MKAVLIWTFASVILLALLLVFQSEHKAQMVFFTGALLAVNAGLILVVDKNNRA